MPEFNRKLFDRLRKLKRDFMKMYKHVWMIATCLLAVILSSPVLAHMNSLTDDEVILTHAKGQTKVKRNPKRVVVFDLGTLETYQALGIPVVGVPSSLPAHLADYRTEQYAKVGSLKGPDLEAVKAAKPDLIIISGRQQGAYDELSAVAPTLFVSTESGDYWTSFERNVNTIASLHGKESEAKKQLTNLRQKADLVRKKSQTDPNKGLVVLHVNDKFAPNGAKSRFGFPFDVLGVKAAIESPANETRQRGEGPKPGAIQAINPDYLFIIDRVNTAKSDKKELSPAIADEIRETKAFKNKKVYTLNDGVWYLSGGGLASVDMMIEEIGSQLYGISF